MDVFTLKVTLVAPAGMTTLDGTLAAPVLLLERATCAPPAGAGPLSVTVPVEKFPPITLVGSRKTKERVRDAEKEDSSKPQTGGLGSLSGTATNFEAEII